MGNWTLSDDRLLVIFDRMRVIRSLIKHGADVNGRNTDMEPRSAGNRYRRRLVGLTAFLSAAKSADVEVMRLLVENGADPKMKTLLNITPLMLTAGIAWAAYQDTASEEQVLEAVKYLVEELRTSFRRKRCRLKNRRSSAGTVLRVRMDAPLNLRR